MNTGPTGFPISACSAAAHADCLKLPITGLWRNAYRKPVSRRSRFGLFYTLLGRRLYPVQPDQEYKPLFNRMKVNKVDDESWWSRRPETVRDRCGSQPGSPGFEVTNRERIITDGRRDLYNRIGAIDTEW